MTTNKTPVSIFSFVVLLGVAVTAAPAAKAQDCGIPYIDVYDSTDPDNYILIDTIQVISTAQTGKVHYNYFSASAHPYDVNVAPLNSNIWVHQNSGSGDLTFGFTFSKDNGVVENTAALNFRIVDSATNPYVSQSDDPGEAVESPAGSNAFIGNYWYLNNTDGIAVSGISGDFTIIIDSVDFGNITHWFAANGSAAGFADDLPLILGHEYRLTPGCVSPSGKKVVVSIEDIDDDGIIDDEDNCIDTPNSDQLDSDGDGAGDVCDACPYDYDDDVDGDGLCGDVDNCPYDANADQIDSDLDGSGDVCDDDDDNDGVVDGDDNCQYDANTDQADFDGDGFGDVCDADDDGDGVIDGDDQCLGTSVGAVVNESGCSIDQLCPCEHPEGAAKWKNHGGYVSCVAHASEDFLEAGLITEEEKDAIVSAAGSSDCGHKNK